MAGGKGKGKGKGKKGKGKKGKDKKRSEQFVPRSLPEDAVTEILLRLPIRSVLRFRCVSKGWCAKIDSPEFRKKHHSYQLARSRYDENDFLVVNREYFMSSADFSCQMNVLSCYDDYKSLSDLNSSCDLDINSIHFSSCSYDINGIVCVIRAPLDVYLCNPALREIRKLPSIPGFPARLGISNPYKLGAVGIGFDDAADDYVVVKLLHDGGDSDTSDLKCVSYHVKTKSWTKMEVPPAIVTAYSSGLKKLYASTTKLYASFFSHGSIHWCMDWCHMILTLNTTTRSFHEIEFPHGWKDCGYDEYLYLLKFDSSSSIALFGFRGRDLQNIDIWVMKEYGVADSWTKQYFISDKTVPGGLPRISRPLCFWRKDKVFLLTRGSKLTCYDLSKGRLHEPPLCGQSESLPDPEPKDYMKGMKLIPVMSGGKKKYLLLPDPDADIDTDTDSDTDYEPPRRGQGDSSSLPHPDMTPLELVTCSGSLISVYQT